MSISNIAKTLGENEYRVKKTKELIGLYSKEEIINLMQKIAEIDLKIKTTDTNPNTEIEIFIINL